MKFKPLSLVTLLSLGLVSTSFACNPPKLSSFEQLSDALQQGDFVKFVFTAGNCQKVSGSTIDSKKDFNMVGGGDFHVYNIYPITVDDKVKNAAATSNTILVEHPKYGAVLNYVRLRVFEDNSAELYSAFYSPTTYEKKAEAQYECQIDTDKKIGGISLIDTSNNAKR